MVDPTQPLAESQLEAPADATVHARLVSLLPAEVPSFDMRTESIVIGRDPEACQILVKDKRVSARHARIYCDKFAYYVEALGSGPTYLQGQLLKKGEVRALRSGDSVSLLYNAQAKINPESQIKHVADFLFQLIGKQAEAVSDADVESRYQITSDLGSGNFSKVLVGIDRRDARIKVAIKKICVEMFEKFRKRRGSKLQLKSEVDAMRSLRHENIVQLIETFESSDSLFLVLELCEGGDLLHDILDRGPFTELHGRRVFREILCGTKYLHDRDIVHRDFKPENILLTSNHRETMVAKISDFGLAVQTGGGGEASQALAGKRGPLVQQASSGALQRLKAQATLCRTFCGTPHYFAPEIVLTQLNGPGTLTYGKEVDMWAVGVILYVMLSAVPPFDQDEADLQVLYNRITAGEWDFDVEEFDSVSPEAKDLVRSLMRVELKTRLTVEQAIAHRWLRPEEAFAAPRAVARPAESSQTEQPAAKRLRTEEFQDVQEGPGEPLQATPMKLLQAAPGDKESAGKDRRKKENMNGVQGALCV